jgi:hypothetical protein
LDAEVALSGSTLELNVVLQELRLLEAQKALLPQQRQDLLLWIQAAEANLERHVAQESTTVLADRARAWSEVSVLGRSAQVR